VLVLYEMGGLKGLKVVEYEFGIGICTILSERRLGRHRGIWHEIPITWLGINSDL
jgi:hypothetical protein